MVITCDQVEYNENTMRGSATAMSGSARDSSGSPAPAPSSTTKTRPGPFTTPAVHRSAVPDQREDHSQGGPEVYTVQEGFITSCPEPRPKCPLPLRAPAFKWTAPRISGGSPSGSRNSCFLCPLHRPAHVQKGNGAAASPHSTAGTRLRRGSVQSGLLSDSGPQHGHDALRRLFHAARFRRGRDLPARPTERSSLYAQAYGISDKLDQGGAHLIVEGIRVPRMGCARSRA